MVQLVLHMKILLQISRLYYSFLHEVFCWRFLSLNKLFNQSQLHQICSLSYVRLVMLADKAAQMNYWMGSAV